MVSRNTPVLVHACVLREDAGKGGFQFRHTGRKEQKKTEEHSPRSQTPTRAVQAAVGTPGSLEERSAEPVCSDSEAAAKFCCIHVEV